MLTQRSNEKELLDLGPEYYSWTEYQNCQKILYRINKYLGIFRDTVSLLKKFPHDSSILDVGCGGGLFLLHLSKKFPNMQFTGIDISHEAILVAQQELKNWQKSFAIKNVSFYFQPLTHKLADNSFDIIITTLVCHHLNDHDLIIFLKDIFNATRKIVIINDLQRNNLALFFYKIISPVFRNRLISHDGFLSIKKSFTRKEWILLLENSGIKKYKLKWRFPFRWSLILWKK